MPGRGQNNEKHKSHLHTLAHRPSLRHTSRHQPEHVVLARGPRQQNVLLLRRKGQAAIQRDDVGAIAKVGKRPHAHQRTRKPTERAVGFVAVAVVAVACTKQKRLGNTLRLANFVDARLSESTSSGRVDGGIDIDDDMPVGQRADFQVPHQLEQALDVGGKGPIQRRGRGSLEQAKGKDRRQPTVLSLLLLVPFVVVTPFPRRGLSLGLLLWRTRTRRTRIRGDALWTLIALGWP